MQTRFAKQDHEAQRNAWAVGWFLSLLKARRTGDIPTHERARTGLAALGIRVLFDEDSPPVSAKTEGGPDHE